MAEFSSIATQTVAVNGNVLFTDAPTSVCNKGYISHRTGSGLINLKGATNACKAKYRVSLGVTDNTTKTITIADNVSDYMADKILCHELVHVYSFSYGCDIDIETEEIIADFMSLYGRNIVYTADRIFDLLEQKYG